MNKSRTEIAARVSPPVAKATVSWVFAAKLIGLGYLTICALGDTRSHGVGMAFAALIWLWAIGEQEHARMKAQAADLQLQIDRLNSRPPGGGHTMEMLP